jgi:hypothetical protein
MAKPSRKKQTAPAQMISLQASMPSYVGSAEHKSYPSPLGNPALRSDATKCPKDVSYEEAREALSAAIRDSIGRGCHSKFKEGSFPRYVWGMVRAGNPPRMIFFEARLTNRETGSYKAWPIDISLHENDHLTEQIRNLLWQN